MGHGLRSTLLVAGWLAACTSPTDELSRQIFEDAVARWAQSGPASYTIVLSRACACSVTGPIKVEVQNQVIVSWTYVDTSAPLEPEHRDGFPDVPGLFDLIRDAQQRNVFYYTAAFDATYGYPTAFEINYTPSSINDDLIMSVSEFTSLAGT